MKHTLIWDYSHIFHASRCVLMPMVVSATGLPPSENPEAIAESIAYLIEGKLRSVHRCLKDLGIEIDYQIFAEDRIATHKLSLMPSYRGDRPDRHEEKNLVKVLLKERGVEGYWCSAEGHEADEAMASLAHMAKRDDRNSIIVTRDRDMWQLIDETISVFDPIKKVFVTEEDIHKAFKVKAQHIALVKSFWGDSGDKIPNLMPRMQRQFLPIIRASDGSFEDCHSIVTGRKHLIKEKCFNMYSEQEQNLRLNYELVRLDSSCTLTWD